MSSIDTKRRRQCDVIQHRKSLIYTRVDKSHEEGKNIYTGRKKKSVVWRSRLTQMSMEKMPVGGAGKLPDTGRGAGNVQDAGK